MSKNDEITLGELLDTKILAGRDVEIHLSPTFKILGTVLSVSGDGKARCIIFELDPKRTAVFHKINDVTEKKEASSDSKYLKQIFLTNTVVSTMSHGYFWKRGMQGTTMYLYTSSILRESW